MIEIEKTEGVLVYAYCDWQPVDQTGKPDKDGKYALVEEVWIHPDHRHNGVLRRLIHKTAQRHPQIKYMYYQRRKYANRFKQYSRRQLKEEI